MREKMTKEHEDAKKSEEEIIQRCRYCIHLIEIRDWWFRDVKTVVDCKIHGDYGWFYWAKELQNCVEYKPNFEGIMKKIIKDSEKKK